MNVTQELLDYILIWNSKQNIQTFSNIIIYSSSNYYLYNLKAARFQRKLIKINNNVYSYKKLHGALLSPCIYIFINS